MQWLTAILAFATTMLIFAVVVTTLVETIHRALGTRTIGLQVMLQHYYDKVLKPHLKDGVELGKEDFIQLMTLARTPIDRKAAAAENTDLHLHAEKESADFKKLKRHSFKRLTRLSTETFMERLGSSSFAEVLKDKDQEKGNLLKDLAQKFESFGFESSLHFESAARLKSVIVAMFVAWIFYVHPYDLIQSYLRDPALAQNIANLAEEPLNKYESLVQDAKNLQAQQKAATNPLPAVTTQDIDKLIANLNTELAAARTEFDKLSQAGAPIGWPDNPCAAGGSDDGCVHTLIWPDKPGKEAFIAINYPSSLKDIFWLLMGGLLIGLGSPFWAKLIGQLSQARSVTKNISNILQPENQLQTAAGTATVAGNRDPVTSTAFAVAAKARPQAGK